MYELVRVVNIISYIYKLNSIEIIVNEFGLIEKTLANF